jgi:hypothetical protein
MAHIIPIISNLTEFTPKWASSDISIGLKTRFSSEKEGHLFKSAKSKFAFDL